jgi:hypothetical protein
MSESARDKPTTGENYIMKTLIVCIHLTTLLNLLNEEGLLG